MRLLFRAALDDIGCVRADTSRSTFVGPVIRYDRSAMSETVAAATAPNISDQLAFAA